MFSEKGQPKLVNQRSSSQNNMNVGRRKTGNKNKGNLSKTRTDQNFLGVPNQGAAHRRVGSAASAMPQAGQPFDRAQSGMQFASQGGPTVGAAPTVTAFQSTQGLMLSRTPGAARSTASRQDHVVYR